MSSQHVVIIGGSSGIGLATAAHLLEKGTGSRSQVATLRSSRLPRKA